MTLEDFVAKGQAAQAAVDAVTPPLPTWECDPEHCTACDPCYRRTGESLCEDDCYHGVLESAELLIGLLQTGQALEREELPRMAHVVTRLVQMVHAAEQVRDARNRAEAWKQAIDVNRREAAAAAVPVAFRTLARVMDGR